MQDNNSSSQLPPAPSPVPATNQGSGVPNLPVSAAVPGVPKKPEATGKTGDSVAGGEKEIASGSKAKNGTVKEVAKKIKDAENVLIALSNDPSVDEMSAAIGLTLLLDEMGMHATSIYSGKTPNVIEFLKPEETFEVNTNSLQDFIITLNKDKADHLRYKIDGDYVKVYITPYKTTLSEKDLEFSRGDFNVDLVVALNVPAATELDGALKEYGRIMHDATSINITNGAAGKFGDLEWVNDKASSICEMAAELALELSGTLEAGVATAFLTGLIAATDKFSNPTTTPEVMMLAAKLMGFGADQQEVIQNISQEIKYSTSAKLREERENEKSKKETSKNEIEINHKEKKSEPEPELEPEPEEKPIEPTQALAVNNDEVQAAMQEAMNPTGVQADVLATLAPASNAIAGVEVSVTPGGEGYAGDSVADQILKNLGANEEDANDGSSGVAIESKTDYGQMIDNALAEPLPGESPDNPGVQADAVTVVPDTGMPVNRATINAEQNVGQVISQSQESQQPQQPQISQEEIDALNVIKEAQNMNSIPDGEVPKIVTENNVSGYMAPVGGQMMSGQGMMMNPAMAVAPGVENMPAVNDVPTMNFGAGAGVPMVGSNAVVAPDTGMQGGMQQTMNNEMINTPATEVNALDGTLPMPGQGMTPPPATPMPEFGTMPPVMPQSDAMGAAPEVQLQPPVQPQTNAVQPTDPGAFQIPNVQM